MSRRRRRKGPEQTDRQLEGRKKTFGNVKREEEKLVDKEKGK